MGKWGNGIFDNDLSLDVKDMYVELLYNGIDETEAQKQVISELGTDFQNFEEMSNFWMSLASVEWEYGRLDVYVKHFALRCIEKELEIMQRAIDFNERYKDVINLKNNLLSTMPSKKILVKTRMFRCPWKMGDVYAYLLESDYAKENGLLNKYLIFHKVDETIWHPKHIIPIVRVKLANKIPVNEEEFDKLEYIQTFFTKYENRFYPIDHRISIEEQIREKSKIEYKRDEFGYLPEYRITISSTSKKKIPQKLIYVGNYKNVIPPEKEFIPHSKINICCAGWDKIENAIVRKYLLYNKRKGLAYGGNME